MRLGASIPAKVQQGFVVLPQSSNRLIKPYTSDFGHMLFCSRSDIGKVNYNIIFRMYLARIPNGRIMVIVFITAKEGYVFGRVVCLSVRSSSIRPQDHLKRMVWYGMVWYGMVWYGMVWYGMVWYGMVWYRLFD